MGESHGRSDDGAVDCASARGLISAAADDEVAREELDRLNNHLDGCIECAAYADRVSALTRSFRLRPAAGEADFVERVMVKSRPARLGRGGWLRPALVWCGLLVMALSVRPLLLGELDDAPTHVARHAGAFSFALGIGFLFAAWKPHRAFGLLPLVVALFTTIVFGAVLDVATGDRSAAAEAVHAVELAGMVLVWLVAGSPGWERTRDVIRFRSGGAARSTS